MTNTTISYADGRTKETLLNGVVKTAYEYGPNWTKTYEGPAGLNSPRWSCSYEDALGRTIAETRPGFRGTLLITSNEYNTANQLVATRSYAIEQSEQSNNRILSSTLICYNNCGERTLTVSDMNRNSQIDWNDTDRIVSNDTRYVSLDGDWWRESSTWQTRQNGSPRPDPRRSHPHPPHWAGLQYRTVGILADWRWHGSPHRSRPSRDIA